MRAWRLALVSAMGLAGCFLRPDPDDAWSDDYGKATDASTRADAPPSACAASSMACVACCDGDASSRGTAFYFAVFECVCPMACAQECGTDCANPPDPNEGCAECLAANARANASCVNANATCDDTCHAYAACIGGCEP